MTPARDLFQLVSAIGLAATVLWAAPAQGSADDSPVEAVAAHLARQAEADAEDPVEQLLTAPGALYPRVVQLAARLDIPLDRVRVRITAFEFDSTTPNSQVIELALAAVEASDDDVLAFTMAHEYAHLLNQDPVRRLSLAYRLTDSHCPASCKALPPAEQWLFVLNETGAVPASYFWASELKADAEGYRRMQQTGFGSPDPESLVTRMAREAPVDELMDSPTRLHPSLRTRIKQLSQLRAAQ